MMKKNAGQAAVFVLLIMLLGLTVGLSVMSRTLQDLKSTTTTDQSSRAFSAAEAGIETALTNLTAGSYTLPAINGVNVNYNIVGTANTYTATISKDEVGQITLAGNTSPITVYWGAAGSGCNFSDTNGDAAIEASLYNYTGASGTPSETYSVNKFAYGPVGCPATNNFSVGSAGSTINSVTYRSSFIINPTIYAQILRIKPIYSGTQIAVTGTFGPQTYTITSTGSTTDGVSRAVQIVKTKPALPPLFDYVLFGGSGGVQ